MIPYADLERALLRWKARKDGSPMPASEEDAPQESVKAGESTEIPVGEDLVIEEPSS